MNASKQVKLLLKQNKEWKQYKKLFRHKQFRLLCTNIALDIKPQASVQKLYMIEKSLLTSERSEKMFVAAFESLGELLKLNYAWEGLGRSAWYCYQTSTYWHDKRRHVPNIFVQNDIVEMNREKRTGYYTWLHSIPTSNKDYNLIVRKVLKRMF